MNISNTKRASIFFAGIIIVGCATTTGVIPKGENLYTINVQRGDMAKVKLRAYQHAEKFCAEKNANGVFVIKENLRAEQASNAWVIDLEFKCEGPVTSKYAIGILKANEKQATKKTP